MLPNGFSEKFLIIISMCYFSISSFIIGQDYWRAIPSEDLGQAFTLAYHFDTIIIGSSKGLFYYSETADSVIPMAEDIFKDKTIHKLESIGGKLYVFTQNKEIYLHEDEWNSIWPELNGYSSQMENILDFGDTILVGARERVYYSTNNGDSWSYLGDSAKVFEHKTIWSLFKSKKGYIYAGTSCGLFRLNEDKTDWIPLEGFDCGDILSFAENSKGELYIGGADRFKGIFKSSDNGDTWKQIYEPEIESRSLTTYSIIIDSENQIIFSTLNNYGIFISEGSDTTFKSINSGLTELNVNALAEDSDGNIFALAGSTLFKSVFPLTGIKNESFPVKNIFLSQNYPNPFNPTTKVKFSLPFSDHVQIKVFDILGREIKTLLNDYKKTGNYEIEFNAAGLPSGIYLYRISSGNYAFTKKMILLK